MRDPVLILGATGGVGEALARRIAARGEAVHLAARDPARLEALATELGCGSSVCDVADSAALERATAEAGGSFAGLVYAVGSIDLAPLRKLTREAMRSSFELNVVGAAEAVRLALPALQAGRGSVVLFSTVAVVQGFPNHAVVASAKGAVEGLAISLAAELAPRVRVNVVAPSLLSTPLGEVFTRDEKLSTAIAGLHPLPRLGTAEDAAALADFLLGPASGWITGQVFRVDGGRSTLRPRG